MNLPKNKQEKVWLIEKSKALRPYLERGPVSAFFLGISSGFPFALVGATLTTRLAQDGISKGAITAFALTFLAYNFKF
jgi:PAT family beta-lactamase induction signal transducer AmpG